MIFHRRIENVPDFHFRILVTLIKCDLAVQTAISITYTSHNKTRLLWNSKC